MNYLHNDLRKTKAKWKTKIRRTQAYGRELIDENEREARLLKTGTSNLVENYN